MSDMLLNKQSIFMQSWAGRGLPYVYAIGIASIALIFIGAYLSQFISISLMGVLAISVFIQQGKRKGNLLLLLTFLLVILTMMIPVKTFLYFSLSLALLVWVHRKWGLAVVPAITALFISSPAFQYAASTFSFPIRLQLTKWVGAIFQLLQSKIVVRGSTIVFNEHEFSVDPACMGLHMLTVSILFGIILIGVLQRKRSSHITNIYFLLFLLVVFGLNIIANLLRMVVLIQFAVMPDSLMHDIIGLLCLLLYVCIPSIWIAARLVKKYGINKEPEGEGQPLSLWLQITIISALVVCGLQVRSSDTFQQFKSAYTSSVPGFKLSVHSPGIIKLENDQSLLYVKFIRGFYDTEHNPTICWKGSGYEFKDVRTDEVNGNNVYMATLEKGREKLYTAWYYTNGKTTTVNQLTWRKDMLQGAKPYAVINITSASISELEQQVSLILSERKLTSLFASLEQ
jgi:exosortase N